MPTFRAPDVTQYYTDRKRVCPSTPVAVTLHWEAESAKWTNQFPASIVQSQTARQLLGTKERIAPSFHVLITTLYDSLTRLTPQERPLCLTHGDCWYKNAIKTPTNRVVLIDWDCAGIGLPILDLGYLLLTAHYDLNQPFQIAINANKIQAIMDGYQHVRRLTQLEAAQLDSAVLFALAFHVAEYVTEQPVIASDDVFLRKVQVRFAASAEITQLARQAIW